MWLQLPPPAPPLKSCHVHLNSMPHINLEYYTNVGLGLPTQNLLKLNECCTNVGLEVFFMINWSTSWSIFFKIETDFGL